MTTFRYSGDYALLSMEQLESLQRAYTEEIANTNEDWTPDHALLWKQELAMVNSWLKLRVADRELIRVKIEHEERRLEYDSGVAFRYEVWRNMSRKITKPLEWYEHEVDDDQQGQGVAL